MPAKVPRGVDWDQNFNDYVDALRECAEACEKAGVMMSIEPHPGPLSRQPDGALRLLEHVNSKAVGINFDPSHTFPIGDFPNIRSTGSASTSSIATSPTMTA